MMPPSAVGRRSLSSSSRSPSLCSANSYTDISNVRSDNDVPQVSHKVVPTRMTVATKGAEGIGTREIEKMTDVMQSVKKKFQCTPYSLT